MKIRTYILGLLGSIILTGCVSEDFMIDNPAIGSAGLTAYVDNGTQQTRLTVSDLGETSPGEEDMNENLLTTIDAFLYKQTDGMTDAAIYHVFDKVSLQNVWTMTQGLSEEKLKQILGVETLVAGQYCTVYILANYGSTADGKSKFTGTESRATLRQLALEADFNPKDNEGNFRPQDCFVMEGTAAAELTGQGIFTLTGQVPLRRVAAKVRLAVTIDPATANGVEDPNGKIWLPEPSTMHVMLTHGVNKGIVCTDNTYTYGYPTHDAPIYFPKETVAEDDWNVYGRKMDQEKVRDNVTWYEHEVPFYSYPTLNWKDAPDNEAYISLSMRWVRQDNPNIGTVTYYQIPIAQRQTEPTLSIKSYRYYRTEMVLGVMGSFTPDDPVLLKNNSYIIVDWGKNDVDHVDNATVLPSMSEVAFLAVAENTVYVYNQNQGQVDYASSHALTQAYVSKVEYLNTGNFQSITRTNGTAGLNTTFQTDTYVNNERFQVSTDNGKVTLTHNISSDQYTRYNVTVVIRNEANISEEIVFTIYPAIYADIETGGDTFVNGRFTHVQNAVGSGTGNNMPWYGRNGYNWYRNETHNNDDFYITTGYGSLRFNLGTGGVNNEALTRIKVTSFNEGDDTYQIRANNVTTSYTFKLADPRVESTINRNLTNYIVTAEANRTNFEQHTASWNNKANIMLGSPSSDAIAPEFIICSGWGRTNGENAQNFQTFERRCATYQEAGYPAGRWRIPTEAELTFIYRLQALGVIPVLFQQNNSAYWASSGRAIESYNAGTLTANFNANPNVGGAGRAGVRCVYDVWYWGDDKMSTNEYHAEP